MKIIVTLFVLALLNACDGGPIRAKASLVDSGVGMGGDVGVRSAIDGADRPDSDTDLLGLDASHDVLMDMDSVEAPADAGTDTVADMPDGLVPDMRESESGDGPAVYELQPDRSISTQIFPGLCCGQPGVGCQNTVTMGACCPSTMTGAECQVMWGPEAWCYCSEGFECYWYGSVVGLDQQWQCQHKR